MKRSIDFGDFEITVREIIASISIISIMLLFGVLISSKISEHQMDKNEIYNKSIKISNKDLFEYGMKTNIGNAFVYGDLEAIDTVGYREVDGKYMSVTKVKERYTRHTRTVTRTRTVNGKSQSYTVVEVYYTWDAIDRWSEQCKKVKFLDVEFNYGDVYIPNESHIDTQKESLNIRYVYYGSPVKYTGTLFTSLGNNTVNKSSFYDNMTIDETVNKLESRGGVFGFWIFWILLLSVGIYFFYYADNDWLEK